MVYIRSIGVALPKRKIDPWVHLAPKAGMSCGAAFKEYMGCNAVRLADDSDIEERASRLALRAAQDAILEGGLTADQIDLVISSNISADYLDWQQSAYIADQLGAECSTFDIYAGCNSTGIALQTAVSVLEADASVNNVLIALSERLGGGTFPQFIADGGCAWVVSRGVGSLEILGGNNINRRMPHFGLLRFGGVAEPFTPDTNFSGTWQDNVEVAIDEYRTQLKPYFVQLACAPIQMLCRDRGVCIEDVKQFFIVHQQRGFNLKVLKHLGVNEDRSPLGYIEDTGHVSGFDVMIGLRRAIQDAIVHRGDMVALMIMGMGELHSFLIRV